MHRSRTRAADGFALVEVMVAMVLLVVGMGAAMKVMDQANATTTTTKAREQGVALQRELVEAARSLSYTAMSPTSIVGLVRATPGFSASRIGTQGWEIVRRGLTYRMTIGVCSVDDPGDGIGSHDATTFCANGAGATSAAQCRAYLGSTGSVAGTGTATGRAVGDCGLDTNFDGRVDALTQSEAGSCAPSSCTGTSPDPEPDDFKRVVTLVRWTVGNGTRFALQSTLIPYPGFSGAPRVVSLDPQPSLSATLPTTTSIGLRASTDRSASTTVWYVDGTALGTATNASSSVVWDVSWPLGPVGTTTPGDKEVAGGPKEVLDGVYELSARAYDVYGAGGTMKTQAVTINRRQPYAPAAFEARRVDNVVETAWQPSRERDVLGYEVWRRTGTTEQRVCALSSATSCRDTGPPSAGTYTYVLYAYDLDNASPPQNRRGDAATGSAIPFDNKVPSAPGGLTALRADASTVKVTWALPATDADGTIASYRIYRDGTGLTDAIGTATALTFTDNAAGGGPHTYYVAAVDDKGAESKRTSGVQA
jgi:type II secretory pathway pseudopilin PulG